MNIQVHSGREAAAVQAKGVDMKLEVVVIPVSDVDRAKAFYASLGWRLDADFVVGEDFRGIQFTPPGSAASIHFGKGITGASPGAAQGLYLVVSDVVATRADLLARGVEVSEVFHRGAPGQPSVAGPHPERRSYFSYAVFKDPDGNVWTLQEVTTRFPGRVDENLVSFTAPAELAHALRRAATAHGEYEKQTGKHDEGWPVWYAEFLFREYAGKQLPQ